MESDRDDPGMIPGGPRWPDGRLVNLTPHQMLVCGVSLPPSGAVARVLPGQPLCNRPGAVMVGGQQVPLNAEALACCVAGLPAPEAGVYLIVSRPVALACAGRPDVYCPGEVRRDEKGQICEALSLMRFVDLGDGE